MQRNNITTIVLLGFPGLNHFRFLFFFLLLLIYCATICGNLVIIILVSYSKALHTPMYFFLTQLTTMDITMTSDIVPNMLRVVWESGSSMSLCSCLTQLFFFGFSVTSECLILTVMSYDRYLAICQPLHYEANMTPSSCLKLIITSWLNGYFVSIILTVITSQVHFCGSNVIDHFYCDLYPVLDVSCSNVFKVKLLATLLSFLAVLCPFLIVVISYAYIVHTIFRMKSTISRHKAFSTCGSHLTVVSIYYGALVSIYLSPQKGKSNAVHKILSMVYTVLTPLTNPVIYCLRNKDITKAFRKISSW